MRLDDLRLDDLLEGRDDGGVLTFAGQRTLLLDAVALGLLRQQLIELFGLTAARGILTRFGYAHGWRTAETLRDALPWEDLREWKRAGGVLHRLQGLVDYRPTSRTDARNRAEARWHDSYEAQQHRLHFGHADDPVCWTLTGFASGYMSRAFEQEIYCIETRCQGRGDPYCHMIGRTREDWGDRFSEIEPFFAKNSLDAALGVVRERLVHEQTRWNARRRDQDLMVDGVGHELVARSDAMRRALEIALRIALVDTTVLITGESGTGKECIARTIHENGSRAQGPFLAVNCGAFPESLIDSELFGHEKGAFTGAVTPRPGVFEAAEGGTLFLDEIGEIPPSTQVRLLRVLQEREVRRVGADRARPIDVRVVAATNRDLHAALRDGSFREDLYYRLRVVEIRMAPLRERTPDVIPLARLFLEQARERTGRHDVHAFSSEALRALAAHTWPGNVRELENTIEAAVALARGERVELADLPEELGGEAPGSRGAGGGGADAGVGGAAGTAGSADAGPAATDGTAGPADVDSDPATDPDTDTDTDPDTEPPNVDAPHRPVAPRTLAEVEREHILATLEASGGVKAEAARRLDISPATLYRKLREYGVHGEAS